MTEPQMTPVTVICTTNGCGNAGHPIEVLVPTDVDPHVVCGVCGQQISEVRS